MAKNILLLTTSNRQGSNSTYAANIFQDLIAQSWPTPSLKIMDLSTATIPPYGSPHGQTPAPDDFLKFLHPLIAADLVVTFAPIYWSRLPGCFLNFQERWSEARQIPELDFAQHMQTKTFSFCLVSGSDPVTVGYKAALWQILKSIENYTFIKGVKVIEGPWFIARNSFELEHQQPSQVTQKLQIFLEQLKLQLA